MLLAGLRTRSRRAGRRVGAQQAADSGRGMAVADLSAALPSPEIAMEQYPKPVEGGQRFRNGNGGDWTRGQKA